ncbi:MAG: nucleoside-diphosphate kinase [Candidatus Komeilibacteria bacterium]
MPEQPPRLPDNNIESNIESVVVVLKPGAQEYLQRLEDFCTEYGLTIQDRATIQFDAESIKKFYPYERHQQYHDMLTDSLSAKPLEALLISGPRAADLLNRLKGHVRGILHLQPPANGIHTSDSPEEADREWQVLKDAAVK